MLHYKMYLNTQEGAIHLFSGGNILILFKFGIFGLNSEIGLN